MNKLAEGFFFNGGDVDQVNSVDPVRKTLEQVFVTINGNVIPPGGQTFYEFFDKSFITTVHIGISSRSDYSNIHVSSGLCKCHVSSTPF